MKPRPEEMNTMLKRCRDGDDRSCWLFIKNLYILTGDVR